MGILKKLSILLLGILPGGCYDDFTPKIDVKPVLCLNARICAGEAIEPLVTRSWLYTDVAGEEDHSVSDSQTKLYVNGEVVDAAIYQRRATAYVSLSTALPTVKPSQR